MTSISFDPLQAHCFDWKKISPKYSRHADFDKKDRTCPECSKPGSNTQSIII